MKKIIVGMMIGFVGATALCTSGNTRCLRRAKRAVIGKIEDVLS